MSELGVPYVIMHENANICIWITCTYSNIWRNLRFVFGNNKRDFVHTCRQEKDQQSFQPTGGQMAVTKNWSGAFKTYLGNPRGKTLSVTLYLNVSQSFQRCIVFAIEFEYQLFKGGYDCYCHKLLGFGVCVCVCWFCFNLELIFEIGTIKRNHQDKFHHCPWLRCVPWYAHGVLWALELACGTCSLNGAGLGRPFVCLCEGFLHECPLALHGASSC